MLDQVSKLQSIQEGKEDSWREIEGGRKEGREGEKEGREGERVNTCTYTLAMPLYVHMWRLIH